MCKEITSPYVPVLSRRLETNVYGLQAYMKNSKSYVFCFFCKAIGQVSYHAHNINHNWPLVNNKIDLHETNDVKYFSGIEYTNNARKIIDRVRNDRCGTYFDLPLTDSFIHNETSVSLKFNQFLVSDCRIPKGTYFGPIFGDIIPYWMFPYLPSK